MINKSRFWTDEQDRIVIDCYRDNYSNEAIGELVGKSANAVYLRAITLGLERPESWHEHFYFTYWGWKVEQDRGSTIYSISDPDGEQVCRVKNDKRLTRKEAIILIKSEMAKRTDEIRRALVW